MRHFIWETVRYQGMDFEDVTGFLMDFLQNTSSQFQRNLQFTVAKVRTCGSNMDHHFADEDRVTPSVVHLTREFIDQSMPEDTFSDYFTAHHLTQLKERECIQCSSLAASYNIVKEYPPFIFILDTQPYAGLPGNTSFPSTLTVHGQTYELHARIYRIRTPAPHLITVATIPYGKGSFVARIDDMEGTMRVLTRNPNEFQQHLLKERHTMLVCYNKIDVSIATRTPDNSTLNLIQALSRIPDEFQETDEAVERQDTGELLS